MRPAGIGCFVASKLVFFLLMPLWDLVCMGWVLEVVWRDDYKIGSVGDSNGCKVGLADRC